MENQSRIEELLAESLRRFDRLAEKVDGLSEKVENIKVDLKGEISVLRDDLSGRLARVEGRLIRVEGRLTNVEGELVKLNLVSSQNSLSLMELAKDRERIDRLEKTVYK
ncbi:hypothetical protein [Chryseolinea lacunae]|uniref:Uncharacterized protein n=1 Tax=Chryseolinea lacunae TaxID=2801331 RepID=A0ABS1KWE4_9BACT|nr:hypothetical protein [Chryseolinea lacunae]MBL0743789.1 hypothetical protein [Chryseolinea lacunae]